jgi:type I restriction enzyme S subunit
MSWTTKTLGELCFIEKGNIGINNAIPGEYPLVVTSEERKSHNEFQFDDEAVIIPLVSSTGHGHKSLKRIHYQSGKFAVGSILCAVIPKDKSILRAEYLYRFLYLNKERELVGRMKGMANVSLPIKEIAKIEIPIPPLDEQENFVESYLRLEESNGDIANELNHQLDLVKQLRQAFLREAMQGALTAKWRKENPDVEPASTLLSKIKAEKEKLVKDGKLKKDKPLPSIKEDEIPFEITENWEWCKLGMINNDLLGGYAFKSDRYVKKSNYQVIRLGNVKPNQLVLETNPIYIDDKYAKEAEKVELLPNDILITMTGTRAKRDYLFSLLLDIKDFNDLSLFLNQRVGCFRFNPNVSYEFINNVLKLPVLLEPIYISATGAANQANIGVDALNNMFIPLPPLSEQQQIVTKLDELMQYCDDLEKSIKTSQQQNEMLLQQVLREALEPKAF